MVTPLVAAALLRRADFDSSAEEDTRPLATNLSQEPVGRRYDLRNPVRRPKNGTASDGWQDGAGNSSAGQFLGRTAFRTFDDTHLRHLRSAYADTDRTGQRRLEGRDSVLCSGQVAMLQARRCTSRGSFMPAESETRATRRLLPPPSWQNGPPVASPK